MVDINNNRVREAKSSKEVTEGPEKENEMQGLFNDLLHCLNPHPHTLNHKGKPMTGFCKILDAFNDAIKVQEVGSGIITELPSTVPLSNSDWTSSQSLESVDSAEYMSLPSTDSSGLCNDSYQENLSTSSSPVTSEQNISAESKPKESNKSSRISAYCSTKNMEDDAINNNLKVEDLKALKVKPAHPVHKGGNQEDMDCYLTCSEDDEFGDEKALGNLKTVTPANKGKLIEEKMDEITILSKMIRSTFEEDRLWTSDSDSNEEGE